MPADRPWRLTAALAIVVFVAGCGSTPDAAPPVSNTTTLPAPSTTGTTVEPSALPDAAPSSVGATITKKTDSGGGRPSPGGDGVPGGSRCAGGHPTAACTGVPAGIALKTVGFQKITTPGAVLDGLHIAGDLLILANNVTVRNSVIDGHVINVEDTETFSFTIYDSTVGPPTGCATLPGIGQDRYTAARVHIRNHGDGFRISGPNVVARDSFVKLCSNPGDHSDGVQDYPEGSNVVLQNNTFDQRFAPSHTAAIFLNSVTDLVVDGNLVMGGTWPLRIYNKRNGKISVTNNSVVQGAWDYGPAEATCASITWSGNRLVHIDDNYRISSVVGPLPCAD